MKDDGPVTFAAGKPFVEEVTAGKLNRVAELGTETARFLARSGLASDDAPLIEHWIGKVVTKGPNNEADLTEQQYWIEKQSPKTNIAFNAALTVESDQTPPSFGATKMIIRATRLTDVMADGTLSPPRLRENTVVHVFAEAWDAMPIPQTFYYFAFTPNEQTLFHITGNRTGGGMYVLKRITPNTSAISAATAVSLGTEDPTEVSGLNLMELELSTHKLTHVNNVNQLYCLGLPWGIDDANRPLYLISHVFTKPCT